jgi:hypothetical protein
VGTSIARTLAIAFMADIVHVGVWSVLEVGVGIIVACCPALRVLLRQAGDSAVPVSQPGRGTYVSHRTDSRAPMISSHSGRHQDIENVGDESTYTLPEITIENVVKESALEIVREGIYFSGIALILSEKVTVAKFERMIECADREHYIPNPRRI